MSYTKFLLHGLFLPLIISAQEINQITMDEAARLQNNIQRKLLTCTLHGVVLVEC